MIKVPEKIKVGPVTYTVVVDEDEWMRLEHRSRERNGFGMTEHHTATIYLNPKDSETTQRQTLLHEALHAMMFVLMGSPNFRNLGDSQFNREERIARMFEGPLLQLLRDNEDMVAYLVLD